MGRSREALRGVSTVRKILVVWHTTRVGKGLRGTVDAFYRQMGKKAKLFAATQKSLKITLPSASRSPHKL